MRSTRFHPMIRMVAATCCYYCCCLVLTAITPSSTTAFSIRPSKSSCYSTAPRRRIAPSNASCSSTTTTLLHLSRKGNRGPSKQVSANTQKRSRPQVNDVLDGISSPPSFPHSVDPAADLPPGPVRSDPLAPLVRTVARAADMRKAVDVVAMRVTACTSLTDFVVIVSGTSRPQNSAIANAIARDVAEQFDGKKCLGRGIPEGSAESGWILLDYGEVMVHVMTPKSRLFYDIEGQWRSRGGEYMDLSDVLVVGGGEEKEKKRKESENGDYITAAAATDVYDDDDDFDDEDGEYADEGNESNLNDGLTMRERLDVEKEIDPFWS